MSPPMADTTAPLSSDPTPVGRPRQRALRTVGVFVLGVVIWMAGIGMINSDVMHYQTPRGGGAALLVVVVLAGPVIGIVAVVKRWNRWWRARHAAPTSSQASP